MGLVMALGPSDHRDRRQERAARRASSCRRGCAQFTCVHSLGHALHARLPRDDLPRSAARARSSARATRPTARRVRSTTTGSRSAAPTRRRRRSTRCDLAAASCATSTPQLRSSRAGTATGSSRLPGPVILNGRATCSGSAAGLAGGAARGLHRRRGRRTSTTRPVAQARAVREPRAAADALACVRGVANQAYAGEPRRELRALQRLRAHARGRADRVRGLVRQDVQRRRERAIPRARVPWRAGVPRACAVGARRWGSRS